MASNDGYEYKLELYDGKYTVVFDKQGRLYALRNGETWRDMTGDGMVLAMLQRIDKDVATHMADQSRIAKLEKALQEMTVVDPLDNYERCLFCAAIVHRYGHVDDCSLVLARQLLNKNDGIST